LKQADKAAEVAPDDPKMVRTKIDALRLSGDLAGARTLVARVTAIAGQPETAYVLAALDLAEESPSWPAVLDRLKAAAAGEQNLQRARGALVYALIRSGDVAGAKSELEKITAATRPHPLLPELKAFVGRASAATLDLDAGKHDGGALAAGAFDARAPEVARGEGEVAAGGDFRSLLQQASQASASRQYDKAEQLYRAALAQNPGDTEALGGLGDVARARGNTSQARSYYEQVLARNPHYLPAVMSLADLKWDSGDRAGAVKLYRDVVETTTEGALAQRAKDRIAQSEAGGSPKPSKPQAPSQRAPSPSQPSELPPEIDTSDLPGFKR
jgi:tetratricopeptide (TPR) repeat protein